MRRLVANHISTAYDIAGAGPPLVLIHGAEADSRMFRTVASMLSPRATVIVYDQRDCGLTEHEADAYTLLDLADDAAALISGLGLGAAHVFGQSLGGLIAQLLAARHPACVERLILGGAMRADASLPDLNPTGMAAAASYRAAGDAGLAPLAALFTTATFVAENPGVVDVWRHAKPLTTPAQRARRQIAIRRPIAKIALATITCPTLVLVGDADQIVPPAHTRTIADDIPGAICRTLPGIGHASALQAPDLLAREIAQFLPFRPA